MDAKWSHEISIAASLFSEEQVGNVICVSISEALASSVQILLWIY